MNIYITYPKLFLVNRVAEGLAWSYKKLKC